MAVPEPVATAYRPGGSRYWWLTRPAGLPMGGAKDNGPLEADGIDTTPMSGIAGFLADECNTVAA